MDKKKKKIIILVAVIALAALGGWKFYDVYTTAREHFPKAFKINNVDCSEMTAVEAADMLTKEWNKNSYIVNSNGKAVQTIPLKGFTYDTDKAIAKLIDPNPFKTVWRYAFGEKKNHKMEMTVAAIPKSTKKAISNMRLLNVKGKTRTKDAFVNLDDTDLNIVKEVYGDNIDKERFISRMEKDIAKGVYTLDYKAEDYYELPKIKSDNKDLLKYQDWCKEHLAQKITYKFWNEDYTITPRQLNKVLSFDDSDKKTVDEKKAKKLMYDICLAHNTAFMDRKFKAHDGRKITVPGGNYGWRIDRKKEEKRLIELLRSGKDETIEPAYTQKPYYKGRDNDIGPNYVEVDLGSQSAYVFHKGKCVVSSDVVTGSVSQGHATPPGTYPIDFKQRNTTLKGFNNDGTPYESKVSYWMPFNGGIGLHDAPWRGSFGGGIYYSGGSHGCVNMPVWAAASTYSYVEAGMPVVVHY